MMYATVRSSPRLPGLRPSNSSDASVFVCASTRFPSMDGNASGTFPAGADEPPQAVKRAASDNSEMTANERVMGRFSSVNSRRGILIQMVRVAPEKAGRREAGRAASRQPRA